MQNLSKHFINGKSLILIVLDEACALVEAGIDGTVIHFEAPTSSLHSEEYLEHQVHDSRSFFIIFIDTTSRITDFQSALRSSYILTEVSSHLMTNEHSIRRWSCLLGIIMLNIV